MKSCDVQGKVTDIILPVGRASICSGELCCQATALVNALPGPADLLVPESTIKQTTYFTSAKFQKCFIQNILY